VCSIELSANPAPSFCTIGPNLGEFGEFLLAEWEYSAKKPRSAQ
jgi:hypothetical protein